MYLMIFAGRDPDLIAHDIGERDHLGHGMLDLDARVHLHEVEPAVLVEKKLKCARARITDLLAGIYRDGSHLLTLFGRDRDRRSFFKQFLMPPLDRAFAFAEMNAVAVLVGQHLDLDVPRPLDITLDVNRAVLECR